MGFAPLSAEPSRFAKLVLLVPSPRYIDDGDYRGGFSRSDIDELLDPARYTGLAGSLVDDATGTPA